MARWANLRPMPLRRTDILRLFAVTFLVLAILVRGMVPAGFMPDTDGGGKVFAMVICSGMGTQTVMVDENGQPVEKDTAVQHCPYAPIVTGAADTHSPVVLAIVEWIPAHFTWTDHRTDRHETANALSRGPPPFV